MPSLPRRLVPVVSALLLAAQIGGAEAQGAVRAWPGFDENDPIGSGMTELWRRVRANCMADGRAEIRTGVAGFPLDERHFTPQAQQVVINMMNGAIGRQQGARNSRFRDTSGVEFLIATGMNRDDAMREMERERNEIELFLRVQGTNQGPHYLVTLTAESARPNWRCFQSTDPFPMAQHLTGDAYFTLDILMTNAMRDVVERARGVNQIEIAVHVRGEPTTDTSELRRDLVSAMRRGIQEAERTQSRIRPDRPRFLVDQPAPQGDGAPAVRRWRAEVVVTRLGTRGFNIEIEFLPEGDTAIATRGLVANDLMPSLNVAVAVASRPAPPPQREPDPPRRREGEGGAGSVMPRPLPEPPPRPSLRELILGETSRFVRDELDPRLGMREFLVRLREPGIVEFDVPGIARGVTPSVTLRDQNGRPLEPAEPVVPQRPNMRRFQVPAGEFVVRVGARTREDGRFMLSARGGEGMLVPEPPAGGRLMRAFQDWVVGEIVQNQRRVACFAYTVAAEVTPAGWRLQRPLLYFSVGAERGAPVGHFFDRINFYSAETQPEVAITDTDGRRTTLQLTRLSQESNNLGVHAQCASGRGMCIDQTGIRGLSLGTQAMVRGRGPDGQAVRIGYSLAGYRDAIGGMAQLCGRRDVAERLVW